jgi:cytochrome c biogenesis protein CcmG/thiol:disulfide interchange protein DsbE
MPSMPGSRSPLLRLLLATLTLAGCSRTTAPDGAVSPVPAVNATSAPLLPRTVNALPSMDVPGYHALLDQLRGTPVVVNVWASWCQPCRREAPLLRAAADAHRGIQFLGVDILDSRTGGQAFLATQAIPYPSVFDPSGAIRTDLGSIGQPVTVFYDKTGAVAAKIDGQLSSSTLDQSLIKIGG